MLHSVAHADGMRPALGEVLEQRLQLGIQLPSKGSASNRGKVFDNNLIDAVNVEVRVLK